MSYATHHQMSTHSDIGNISNDNGHATTISAQVKRFSVSAVGLSCVAAHYKNAIGHTFVLTVDAHQGDLLSFIEQLERVVGDYDLNYPSPERVQFLFSELDEVARQVTRHHPVSQRQTILCIMNVFWLELRGHLKTDDCNGMQYIHAFNASTPKIEAP